MFAARLFDRGACASRRWFAAFTALVAALAWGADATNSTNSAAAADRHWIDSAGGLYDDAGNWSTTAGGAGGASVPGAADRALFERTDATYTVTMPGRQLFDPPLTVTTTRIDVGDNSVTLQDTQALNRAPASVVTTDLKVGFAGDDATLTSRLSNVTASFVTVGEAGPGTAALNIASGALTVTGASASAGALVIGSMGNGAMTISGGSTVALTSTGVGADVRVASGLGSTGQLTVTGAGSSLTMPVNGGGVFSSGSNGAGSVTVFAGGLLDTRVFQTNVSEGTATVSGAGSLWKTKDLSVGSGIADCFASISAGGRVESTSGAVRGGTMSVAGANSQWLVAGGVGVGGTLNDALLDIGAFGRVASDRANVQTGSVTVHGTGARWDVAGTFSLAAHDPATVTVTGGGTIETGATWLGINNLDFDPAHAVVDGLGGGATWSATGVFRVGVLTSATLTIANGGVVKNLLGYVGDGNSGTVNISGAGSTWESTESLIIGGDGFGTLNVTGGGQVKSGQAFVGQSFNRALVAMDGATTKWTNAGNFYIGVGNGRGEVRLSGGATIDVGGAASIGVDGVLGPIGSGVVDGDLTNAGLVGHVEFPNPLPGALTVTGDYEQTAEGTFLAVLSGTTPGSGYSRLLVGGQMTLAGTLQVELPALTPAAGLSFDLLDWGTLSGTFDALALPTLGANLAWDASQLYVTGVLRIVNPNILAGDFDENLTVAAADLTNWRMGAGTTMGATHMQGDADGDGDVDGSDFLVWQRQLGSSSSVAAGGGVPEPGALGMAAFALAAVWRRRR